MEFFRGVRKGAELGEIFCEGGEGAYYREINCVTGLYGIHTALYGYLYSGWETFFMGRKEKENYVGRANYIDQGKGGFEKV
eukprot:scaffold243433_cov19-Tisochrysis_lutea.AAC.1